MRRFLPALAVLAAVSTAPSTAGAQNCVAPPGTAAIEQYCETVPDAANRGQGTASERRRLRQSLPPRQARRLEQAGADGQAVLALPAAGGGPGATGTAGAGSSRSRQDRASGVAGAAKSRIQPDAAEPSSNPLDAIANAVGTGGGVSGAFGWLLMGTALAAAALAWTRMRRRPQA